MNSWYTVKVKYTKQFEDGRLKRVTEPYLVDAVSFTDAEGRIYEEVGTSIQGEFHITGISKTEFADIFYYEDCDTWYKCKLTYVSMDEDSGKEKKTSNNFLVTASNVKEAYDRIQESMQDMMVTFEVPSIMLSPIVEVLPYNPDLDVELDRRPLNETEETSYDAQEVEEAEDTMESGEMSHIQDDFNAEEDFSHLEDESDK